MISSINHDTQARDLIAVMRDVAADPFTLEVSVELPAAGTPPLN